MIDVKDALLKIREMFSENGLQIANVFVKIDNPADINISLFDDSVKITFTKNKPKIKIKKIISFSVNLSAINLSEYGGVLEVDHFPDIPFKYDWITPETKK